MDATTVTLALMQTFVGPENKINEMSDFYDALVKALEDAHAEGRDEATQENAGVSAEVKSATWIVQSRYGAQWRVARSVGRARY